MGDCSAIFLTFTMIELCLRCAERGKKSHEHHFMWGGEGRTTSALMPPLNYAPFAVTFTQFGAGKNAKKRGIRKEERGLGNAR